MVLKLISKRFTSNIFLSLGTAGLDNWIKLTFLVSTKVTYVNDPCTRCENSLEYRYIKSFKTRKKDNNTINFSRNSSSE